MDKVPGRISRVTCNSYTRKVFISSWKIPLPNLVRMPLHPTVGRLRSSHCRKAVVSYGKEKGRPAQLSMEPAISLCIAETVDAILGHTHESFTHSDIPLLQMPSAFMLHVITSVCSRTLLFPYQVLAEKGFCVFCVCPL